jgi:acyl-coenzyme A synthetase/AMP-(fatty) acid ligase
VLIVDDETLRNLPEFARTVHRHGIRSIGLLPSQLAALLESDAAVRHLNEVERVLVGGEALAPATAARIMARLPRAALINAYGLSETGGAITSGRVTTVGQVAIGRPHAAAQVYVLDRLAPVAREEGELCVGGEQLSRGYQGQPALTAERFVPDPFCRRPGARLFRTRDAARVLEDGSLLLLGRIDDEVKIRGHRVILAEIERALGGAPGVDEAAVVVHSADGQHGRLAAFVRRSTGTPPQTWSDLRHYLRDRVPDYMVPATFEAVNDFPRLPGGKIDRRLLAARVATRAATASDTDAAEGARTQDILAEIWSEVLERPVSAPDADFFELGGESLLAMRVLSRVAGRCGVSLVIEDLLDHSSLAALASVIYQRRASQVVPP